MTNCLIFYGRMARAEAAFNLSTVLGSTGWATEVRLESGGGERVVFTDGDDSRTVTWDAARKSATDDMEFVSFKLLTPTAILPTRGSARSAGLDLYFDADEPVQFLAGARKKLSTGVAVECPEGYYARVAPRSGMSDRGFDIGAGVIDEDYRGEIAVLLSLHSSAEAQILKPGDRIAQLVFERCGLFQPIQTVDLSATKRGGAGFGSTGR